MSLSDILGRYRRFSSSREGIGQDDYKAWKIKGDDGVVYRFRSAHAAQEVYTLSQAIEVGCDVGSLNHPRGKLTVEEDCSQYTVDEVIESLSEGKNHQQIMEDLTSDGVNRQ